MADNVLLWSDIHVHAHKRSVDRLQDCLRVLDWVFRTAVERQVADLIFLGDLFHDRTRIEVLTLHRVIEVFEKYFGPGSDSGLRLWLLLGNHDLWHRDKRDVYSPKIFSMFPGITVVDQPCTLDVAGHAVDFLPFTENPIVDLDFLRHHRPRKPGERRLLCAHIAIDGAKLNSAGIQADVIVEHDGEMVKVDAGFLSGWNKVFLGHYHAEQAINDRVEYVGSPMQLSFSEAFQEKHILEFDLATFQKTTIVNDFSPVHLIIKPEEVGKYDLAGNFVSVRVDNISAADVVDIRRDITENYEVGTLEITPVKKPWTAPEVVHDAKAILFQEDEMLERWTEECCEEGLDKPTLLSVGKRICRGVRDNP